VAWLALACAPSAAWAVDEFEIQVYDAETAPVDESGFELHLNHDVRANLTHLTLEPHLGLLPWLEAGAYFQTALVGDRFAYGGAKLRVKGRVPWRLARLVGLALNLELSAVPAEFESNRLGMELRPIVDVRWWRLYVSVNPIVSIDLMGGLAGHPQLEPCATVTISIINAVNFGAEYYAGLGPIDAPFPVGQQVHRLFAVTNIEYHRIGLNLGVGYGLAGGERWIVKSIVGLAL
jgi:hypothetical protein